MSGVRGIVRGRGQVTIPAELREAAHIEEGDPIDMELVDGAIVIRPLKAVDASQAWFWTKEWQAGEREAEADAAAGRVEFFGSSEEFLASFDK